MPSPPLLQTTALQRNVLLFTKTLTVTEPATPTLTKTVVKVLA